MHLPIFTTVLFLTVPALGYSELKWYASRSAVVCAEVPEQGTRLRVRNASGRGELAGACGRGDRLLLVIGSFAKRAVELPLRLHKGRIVRAVDLETDKPLVCECGVASLTLKPHDFALVLAVGAPLASGPLARR